MTNKMDRSVVRKEYSHTDIWNVLASVPLEEQYYGHFNGIIMPHHINLLHAFMRRLAMESHVFKLLLSFYS